MKTAGQILNDAHKVVVKLGSSTISDEYGHVDYQLMESLVEQMANLIKSGKRLVVVSSGAAACGVGVINKWHRKNDVHYKQALCAIGQVELMSSFRNLFNKYDLHVAQLLFTKDDFHDANRKLNLRNTLFTLIDEGIIPIINENDSVSVDEIKIGDNDTLSALTAILWGADALVLMSDVDGLYDKNPNLHTDAKLIEQVSDINICLESVNLEGKGVLGTGGMATKISAAERANGYGIPVILTNSGVDNVLIKLMDGDQAATVFLSDEQ